MRVLKDYSRFISGTGLYRKLTDPLEIRNFIHSCMLFFTIFNHAIKRAMDIICDKTNNRNYFRYLRYLHSRGANQS